MTGVFVAFEGGEGGGKSTQIELLAARLREAGQVVTVTHEPGATELGAQIRNLLLHQSQPLAPRAEALLFAADRAHHVATVIRPALERGEVVLTDRYIDSSLAYQGVGRGLSVAEIRGVSLWASDGLLPDLTVLLDIDVQVGLARATQVSAPDRLEAETVEFHERVRLAFGALAAADPQRYVVIDAARSASQVAAQVLAAVTRVVLA